MRQCYLILMRWVEKVKRSQFFGFVFSFEMALISNYKTSMFLWKKSVGLFTYLLFFSHQSGCLLPPDLFRPNSAP